MAQNYTRQSSFADGDTITASLFNNEYNQLVNAFAYSSTDVSATGHRHDGSIGQGGNIAQIGDLDFNNKIVVDGTNNRWGFFVEVAGASVEQIRLQDGSIIPVTTNDIDLGSASLQFKDAYFDGTVNADSLVLSSGATVTAILDEDAMTSNSATALATQQSIKAYVDSQVTAQDLDFQGDSGGALSIDLDSETLTIAGGTGIDTSGAINTLTVSIDSTVATLTGTQTLTNKTLTSPDINGGTIDGAIIGATTAAAGSFTTVAASGNITVGGTVDGRDVAADGTKLDGIESGATADQTAAEIRALVEAATDSNVFTDADHTKLNGIEALADVTDTTNVTAAGALMDSELTNITAVKALNQGVATTDSPSFAGLTATTADINGGTIDGTVIGATTPAAGSFTTISASGEIAANGGVAFGDNDKATFGASDDLQIYHDGSNSYISDQGTGDLNVLANKFLVKSASGGSTLIQADPTATNVQLFFGNAAKLATTSTGIDVTGTVTADGLTVDAGTSTEINLPHNGFNYIDFSGAGAALIIRRTGDLPATRWSSNGDINLGYEDTGTTAKLFWDASAESLGIGTTSPTYALDVVSTGSSVAGFYGNSGTSFTYFGHSGGTNGAYLYNDNQGNTIIDFNQDANVGTQSLRIRDNGTERMRIDSSGNVGIGTTNPFYKLVVSAGGASGIEFGPAYSGTANLVQHYSRSGGVYVDAVNDAAQHRFNISGSERARIDASGNLLVGKTATTLASVGHVLWGAGSAYHTADGAAGLHINRKTSDGDIVTFRKDGTTVGSIGARGGDMFFTAATVGGLRPYAAGSAIIPCSTAGSGLDATLDLASAAWRFKDLYLSGGVYLGGTGAANKLDDYEEGTWSPAVFGSSVAGAYTYGNGYAVYTKVGRQVTVSCVLTNVTTTTAGSGYLKIGGLPFTKASNTMFHGSGRVERWNFGSGNTSFVPSFISASATNVLYFRGQESSGNGDDMLITDIASGATDIELTITYFV